MLDASGGHPVAKKGKFGEPKGTFFRPNDQTVSLELVKDFSDMSNMVFLRGTSPQNVIKIDKIVQEPLLDVVHQSLKNLSCVVQAEWQPQKLLQTKQHGYG